MSTVLECNLNERLQLENGRDVDTVAVDFLKSSQGVFPPNFALVEKTALYEIVGLGPPAL
jgi:hypothetical protein